jgi:hypothetical protein
MFDGQGDPLDALQVGASRAFTALCPRQRGRQQNWQQSDDVNEAKPLARGIGSLGIAGKRQSHAPRYHRRSDHL